MSKKIFCQHPYELEQDERMKRLDKKFPDSGHGVFWKIYHRIRLGNGTYPITALYAEISGSNKQRQHRLRCVLTDFDLFIIENNMVTLANGLTISELHPRQDRQPSSSDRLKKIQENIQKGYDNTLFPEESRQMDEEALQRVQEDIREANEEQLNLLTQ